MSGQGARRAAPSVAQAEAAGRAVTAAYEPTAFRFTDVPQDYPQVVYPHDPRDTRYDLLSRINAHPTYQITDKEIDYLQHKQYTKEHHEWLAFLHSQFNITDQAEAALAQELVPEMFDGPQAYFDAMMDNVQQFVKIDMRGVKTREDLMFLFKLAKGAIHVPAGFTADKLTTPLPAANINNVDPNDFKNRGWLNPRKYMPIGLQAMGRPGGNPQNPFAARDEKTVVNVDRSVFKPQQFTQTPLGGMWAPQRQQQANRNVQRSSSTSTPVAATSLFQTE
jgi:hypothetical protein